MKKNALFSFFLVFFILSALFYVSGFAPFGEQSLAGDDARIQYIDFFLYYKDVLSGRNSLAYTFSNLLGDSTIALFSYYLASPLNLLIVFFDKTQVLSFFDLLILLKASLAAACFSVFLSVRFRSCADTRRSGFLAVFLSACYGLSEYILTQCANLMWLDGAVILPLVMLGVYEVVNGRALWRLSVPVLCSVLLNWYTAGMNCLFSGVWFILEYALLAAASGTDAGFRRFFRTLFRWLAGMLLGLLCSSILFLPTVLALTGNAKASLNFWALLLPVMRCPLYTAVESSVYGARSTATSLTLFCGVLPIVGVSGFFFRKERPAYKLIFALFLLFLVLMYCWFPLYSLFVLLENPARYFCRYSYLQEFGVLFVAAWSLLNIREGQRPMLRAGAISYAALLLLTYLLVPYERRLYVAFTAFSVVLVSFVLHACLQPQNRGLRAKRFYSGLLAMLLTADLTAAAFLQLNYPAVYANAGPETPAYIAQETQLIQSLSERDPGVYRISQTRNRWTDDGHWTANYSESLAYGFRSNVTYSSTASSAQLSFLEKAGYRTEADVIGVVNTSVLGVDSLLGVKYVLTDVPVNGLTEIPEITGFDGKKAYRNLYALPMAFQYSPGSASASTETKTGDNNPFVYQNRLYSELLGEDIELYAPVAYSLSASQDAESGESVYTYRLMLPDGHYAVYGNIPWEYSKPNPLLNLNGRDHAVYACWLSPSVFYIPTDPGDSEAVVTLSGTFSLVDNAEQFYALNLELLEQAANRLQSNPANSTDVQNGHIQISTLAAAGEQLFLSVPYGRGWDIRLNGERVEPELFADLFCTFPLREGQNTLEMHYNIPGLTEGILLSVLGLILLSGSAGIRCRKKEP